MSWVSKKYGKCLNVIDVSVEKFQNPFTIGMKFHILVGKFVGKNLKALILIILTKNMH